MLAGYLTGVGMALLGYGYWALVGASVTQVAIRLVLAWLISGWRPKLPSRNTQTWHMLTFRRQYYRRQPYIFARPWRGQPIDWPVFWRRCGRFVFEGLHPSHPAAGTIHQYRINAVLVPALSRIQTATRAIPSHISSRVRGHGADKLLSTGLLLALARPLTLVVLGPKWEQAAPIFAGFRIAALCIPLAGASTWLFQTQGRGKDWLFASLLGSCHYCCLVCCWSPVWSCRSGHRLFRCRAFHRRTDSLLFCRTGGSRQYG